MHEPHGEDRCPDCGTVLINEHTVPDKKHPYRCLFNTKAFFDLRGVEHAHQTLVTSDGVKIGDVAVVDGVNGWRAPFGGIDLTRVFWQPDMIFDAVARHDFGDLREIRCKPCSMSENEAAIIHALLCNGWHIAESALSFVLPTTDMNLWHELLPRQTIHSLKKAAEMGIHGEEMADTPEEWAAIYELLAANRAAKRRELSIDFDYLLRLSAAFPGLIRGIIVTDEDHEHIYAAAIVYRHMKGRDMVQSWGDLPDHGLGVSPMPMLAYTVIRTSELYGSPTVDLGISTNDGMPDAGLCRAKRGWGARAETRFVLRR